MENLPFPVVYLSVCDTHDALSLAGQPFVVSDQYNGVALGVQSTDDLEHPGARSGVQVARRFIREDERRMCRDGASHGHTLLLAAGHLVWTVVHTGRKAHTLQGLQRQQTPFSGGQAPVNERQLHVFQRVQVLDQVEALENKTDLFIADG